ncbi:hypothetical protein EGW08_011849 [Elysia chlorotica]|uniref:Uncharacterized protein n=1 Tax=Elysia chlorotica TaxID=188477 RepID=A0A3S1B5J0_ELYCH|nr:hypothetical protein EGW08_011849 [Elysia chlorotica]
MNLTPDQYARVALNLLNPRTPEERVCIAAQQMRHPCRFLLAVQYVMPNLETELGIEALVVEPTIPDRCKEKTKNMNLTPDQYARVALNLLNPRHVSTITAMTVRKNQSLLPVEERERGNRSRSRPMGKGKAAARKPRQSQSSNVEVAPAVARDKEVSELFYGTSARGWVIADPLQATERSFHFRGNCGSKLNNLDETSKALAFFFASLDELKKNVMNQLLVGSGQIPPETDMLNFFTCPHEQRWPSIHCMDALGVRRNGDGKMESVQKKGSILDLLKELKSDINEPTRGTSFIQHLFTAYRQYAQFKSCRMNSEEDDVEIRIPMKFHPAPVHGQLAVRPVQILPHES